MLAGGYLWLENARLRNQMAQTQAERAALQQREQDLQKQLDEQRSANAQTASELAGVRERLAQQFYEPLGGTAERFAAAMRADIERYGRAIKVAGIKPE